MAIEYETQVLDIDEYEIRNKLDEIGAEYISENFMRRWVYYIDESSWIRLRDNWEKVAITYKKRWTTTIWETEEIETKIENFDDMAEMLGKLNFYEKKYYQENKRILYKLGDTEFCIDSWPKIPTYLEIESSSEEKVLEWLNLLWLESHEHWDFWSVRIYNKYGLDIHAFEILKF